MSYETLQLLIDGKWRAGSEGVSEAVLNPATDEELAQVPHASEADLDEALVASLRGFEVWRKIPPADRQKILEKAASLLEARIDIIAENLSKEMGKTVPESHQELSFAISILRWYGEEGKRAYGREIPARAIGVRQIAMKQPVGPCLAFVAWNFPAVNAMRKIAGALGAGCSIIIKPSEETPATAISIARALIDAGLPDGVLNVVFGKPAEVSEYLLASPVAKKVSFTGSVEVGKHLQRLAANTLKRCTMELGGHAPFMVFDDANIELAAKMAVVGKFRNAGQVCVSPTRFLVQDAVFDEFNQRFLDETAKIKVGNGLNNDSTMGALVSARRLEAVDALVQDAIGAGAKLATGGARIGNRGNFYQPTILTDVPKDCRIMNEEPFGPVAAVSRFVSTDEILTEANRLPFGLAAYAFTSNPAITDMLADDLQSGMLAINSLQVAAPETPFGGIQDSGYGSEGGIEGLDAFMQTRLVTYSRA
ncbi:NAD-dependent succinate-semialdehyde dehydrogenase [Ahrensia kielensis]|uniref:NAD-dependent succinate-semialdehyde dehydrogenase n=1 Tax=Ahrensia kielensis TaxID=76980 RepID=A0ABU9T2Q9_9HYPH